MPEAGPLRELLSVPAWEGDPLPEPPHDTRLSPHRDRRTVAPSLIVIHCTAGSTTDGAIQTMLDRGVSSQIVIPDDNRSGEPARTVRIVEDTHFAFHVRALTFGGVRGINFRSFGIEIVHTGQQGDRYTDLQVRRCVEWCRYWMSRHPITHVITHSFLDPTRRSDPTVMFPWDNFKRLLLEGLPRLDAENNRPILLEVDGRRLDVETDLIDGSTYVNIRDLAEAMRWGIDFEQSSRTVRIRTRPEGEPG